MTPLAGPARLAFILVASPYVKVWVEILPSNECAIGNLDVGSQGFLELRVSTTPPSVTRSRSHIPANSNMISSACSIFSSFNKPPVLSNSASTSASVIAWAFGTSFTGLS
jgi:hypothetical protein